jgi:hypothetical protein
MLRQTEHTTATFSSQAGVFLDIPQNRGGMHYEE